VALNYHEQDLEEALDIVRLARKTTYQLTAAVPLVPGPLAPSFAAVHVM